MIVRDPDGSVTVIDFREIAPYAATRDMFKGDSNLIRSVSGADCTKHSISS